MVEKLFPDPFLKYQNWAYLWINSPKFIHLIVCQVEGYPNILKLNCKPLAFTSYKAFLKTKRGMGLVFFPHFLHDFWRKIFFLLYSVIWPNLIWDIEQCVYCNCLLTRLWRHKFWNQPYASDQTVHSTCPKCQDKNLNILKMKRASKMKQKAFTESNKSIVFERRGSDFNITDLYSSRAP